MQGAAGAPLPAGLKVLNGDRAGFVLYPLGAETIIGRQDDATVFLPDPKCSRHHCHVRWSASGAGFVLVDVSSNGTWINGSKATPQAETPLKTGDQVRVGGTELEFRLAVPAPAPAPEPAPEPAPAAVEFEFDFSAPGGSSDSLDKVFFEPEEAKKWSSRATQRIPRLDPTKHPPPPSS